MVSSESTNLFAFRSLLDHRERESLVPEACHSFKAFRRISEKRLEQGYRQPFSVDADRILHSLAYTRYIDKTQVFHLIENDHITHRVLHVQFVSKISRTIGRYLGLNEDLIEAIALGHDIGHPPFGHDGERMLSALTCQAGIGEFHHNIQSVRFLDMIERKGKGWNLCMQTLDGILCHDGEVHDSVLKPKSILSFEQLLQVIDARQKKSDILSCPATLEGCVVRLSDTIGYVGRDLEDAIRLGLVTRSDIPQKCQGVLGETNGTIVYNLVTDVISNSLNKPFIAFSEETSEALQELKKFNYERIYLNPKIKTSIPRIQKLYAMLFEQYLHDLEIGDQSSLIFSKFLNSMSQDYIAQNEHAEIARDFIAGMTDQYFLDQFPEDLRPPKINFHQPL